MKIDGITNKNKVNVCQTFCEKSIFDDFSLRNGLWKVREETRKGKTHATSSKNTFVLS